MRSISCQGYASLASELSFAGTSIESSIETVRTRTGLSDLESHVDSSVIHVQNILDIIGFPSLSIRINLCDWYIFHSTSFVD